jgi:adenylate kinase
LKQAKVIFLGGVHGVGKSTLASLCREVGVEHLSASGLIRATSLAPRFDEEKRVKDLVGNQEILINALNARTASGGVFLLDGHYTLRNAKAEVEKIPLATFQAISPCGLGIVVDSPGAIVTRLQSRGGMNLDVAGCEKMQQEEVSHANSVAKALGVDLRTFEPGDETLFRKWLQEI